MKRLLVRYGYSPLLPATAAFVLLVVSLWGLSVTGLRCTKIASAANGALPSDFCYVVPVSATWGSTTSTLTDVAVRIPSSEGFNAIGLVNSGLMDAQAWDAKPTTSGFQESDLFAQDMLQSSGQSPWWFHVPSIGPGSTVSLDLYFGSDIQRDQGLLFTGGDSVTVAHHADFNIADNLTLSVGIELLDLTAQNATLATHRNGSAGYSLSLVASGSTLVIRGQVDGQTCDVNWPTATVAADTTAYIDMTFVNPTLTVEIFDANGTSRGSNPCATGLSVISATTTAFTVGGNGLNRAIIRDVKLMSGSATNLHWGFNPLALTELTAVNPTYTGTVTDESPLGHDGTYSLTRNQTGWTVDIGAVRLVSAGSAIPATPTTNVSLLGSDQFGGFRLDLTATPVSGDTFQNLFGATVREYATAGGNQTFAWTAFFVVAAVGFLVIGWTAFHYIPLAILFAGVPLVFGTVRQFVPGWVLIVWGLFVILSWFAVRRGEAPGG